MKSKVKYIPYGRQYIDEKDIKSVVSVLCSDFITQGPKIRKFENRVANYCGVKYAVAVSSGTAALHIACLAGGIKNADEVITSPISFVASSNCILYCGARPVFADIQEDTINIDPQEIAKNITKRTRGIIAVHFAGHPCDLEEIQCIAKKNNLIVIEDAAHALGAEYKGSKIGSCKYSDMAILSFHPVKHITTGEGGTVLTNDKKLYEKLLMLRNHGITRGKEELINKNEGSWYYEMQELGFNYRITDFQCALGTSQLKKIEGFIRKRKRIASYYHRELSKIDGLGLPIEKDYVNSSWHIYVVRVRRSRRRIFETLSKAGIGVNVHYRPIYLNPYYQRLGYEKGLCPDAEKYYNEALTIPLYPKMREEEAARIVTKLKESLS